MKVKLTLLLTPLFVIYAYFAFGATIETVVYPQYVDGREDGNPFAVFVRITGWTTAKSKLDSGDWKDITVGANPESGYYHIWDGQQWNTAYAKNCFSIKDELDSNGNWEGWIFLKSRGKSGPFKAFAARETQAGNWAKALEEDGTHVVTLLGGSGQDPIAVCYAKADSPASGKVIAAYANEGDSPPSQQPLGTYAIEDNSIDENVGTDPPYPPDTNDPDYAKFGIGYFRLALPRNTTIEKFVSYERIDSNYNGEPEIFDVDTKSEKGYFWVTGDSKTKDLEEGNKDISLPVILSLHSAEKKGDRVIIRWSTESEVDIVGWNVYRESKDGWVKINSKLIPSKGEMGGRYEFLDPKPSDNPRRYVIEWVNLKGERERSEPITLGRSGRLKAITWAEVKTK